RNLAEADQRYAHASRYQAGDQFAGIGPSPGHGIGRDQNVHRTSRNRLPREIRLRTAPRCWPILVPIRGEAKVFLRFGKVASASRNSKNTPRRGVVQVRNSLEQSWSLRRNCRKSLTNSISGPVFKGRDLRDCFERARLQATP